MSDTSKNPDQLSSESCNCSDPNCCQPAPRKNWQKYVFLAVVLLAAGIIAFKLLYAGPKTGECSTKGCCADSTQCSGKTNCSDSLQNHDLKQ